MTIPQPSMTRIIQHYIYMCVCVYIYIYIYIYIIHSTVKEEDDYHSMTYVYDDVTYVYDDVTYTVVKEEDDYHSTVNEKDKLSLNR